MTEGRDRVFLVQSRWNPHSTKSFSAFSFANIGSYGTFHGQKACPHSPYYLAHCNLIDYTKGVIKSFRHKGAEAVL
jgi:hypothetical protein